MDDFSPAPIAPALDVSEPQVDPELLSEDVQLSESFFHPAWSKVAEIFDEVLAQTQYGTNDAKLPADEYKIEDQVNKRVAAKLKEVLLRIQSAVESVESIKAESKKGK